MNTFRKFFRYFAGNKQHFIEYSILSLFVGILELFGVALTYPFVLALLTGKNYHGISSAALGVIIFVLFLSKNLFMVFYVYIQSKYIKNIEKNIDLKFMRYFLSADYLHVSKISLAEKVNLLNLVIPNTVNNYLLRILNLCVNFCIFFLISGLLVIKFPIATALTSFFATILIFIQNKFFKPILVRTSEKIITTFKKYTQSFNESVINIKGVKISNNEKMFFNNYTNAIVEYFKNRRKLDFINQVPPFITEPCVIVILFILLGTISYQNYTEPAKLVASYAIIVSAIFRLTPVISRIQSNLSGIYTAKHFVEQLINCYEEWNVDKTKELTDKDFADFKIKIELKNITFGYEKNKPVLKGVNLEINKGEFIGIAGLSGVGKTTLVDIIAGLLKPDSGEYLVDGSKYEKPLKIGYIPQEFSTINGTIRENVAFGAEDINDERVIIALKQACLYDFIENNYKEGIYSNPFTDSTGFSLGQKQRLAIARALYSNPDILILDEATSSLDMKTEGEICTVLNSLKGEKTIIAIAHRLSTIKTADKTAFLNNGVVENFAPFNDLVDSNSTFRELVRISSLSD